MSDPERVDVYVSLSEIRLDGPLLDELRSIEPAIRESVERLKYLALSDG